MTNEPVHVTDETFEKNVMNADIPVLVDFWAPWCGPCKMVEPVLENIAEEYADKIKVVKVNTDKHNTWSSKFGVQGIPTFLFIADGKEVHRQVGALPESLLRKVIIQFLEVVGNKE